MNSYVSQSFRAELHAIGYSPIDLANKMIEWGDPRNRETIIKSIQRMCSGTTSVSGEMRVILNMLLYNKYTDRRYTHLDWITQDDGHISAEVDGFVLKLLPQSKGRWAITIDHEDGYSHQWPAWQDNLESARDKAIETLHSAIKFVVDYKREKIVQEYEANS